MSGGTVPLGMGFRRCSETRAHYAHEWYDPLRQNCPGGPEETPKRCCHEEHGYYCREHHVSEDVS